MKLARLGPFVLALVAIPLASSADTAKLPSPENSDIPCGIQLVGTSNGVADRRGEFTFVIRDIVNIPIANASVTLDFCACGAAQGLCIAPQQPDPNVWVSPDGCQVSGLTAVDGTLRLSLIGHATTTDAGVACAPRIYADGISFEYSTHPDIVVAAYDLDGAQGVAPPDLSRWLDDSFAASYRSRADYDCSRTVTPVDLAKLLDVSLAGGSATSAANCLCH
jgi:hypothetical protein